MHVVDCHVRMRYGCRVHTLGGPSHAVVSNDLVDAQSLPEFLATVGNDKNVYWHKVEHIDDTDVTNRIRRWKLPPASASCCEPLRHRCVLC